MTKAQLQFCFAYGGIACTVLGVAAAAAGFWTVAAIGFSGSSACWAYSQRIADQRRERLGSAIIRETRRVEEHALGNKRQARARGSDLVASEFRVAATTTANLRTAISRIIDHA